MTEEPYGDQWFQHLTANIRRILEQTQAVLPIPRFTSWLYQPIFICLGRPVNPVDETATPENLDLCNQV
ncbi:MAG: hypothetical protein ACLUAO_07285 [Streptococcus sp.]